MINYKICRICNVEKPFTEYRNRADSKDGKRSDCKACQNERNKVFNSKNKIKISKSRKIHYDINKTNILKQKKEDYYSNRNKFIKRQSDYNKKRKSKDPIYKLKRNIRIMISKSLKSNGFTKHSQSFIILGCDFNTFITHITSKMKSWMTWDNYGKYNGAINFGWDIDHLIPLASATTEKDIIKLNHYTNLQPLCSYINRNKKRDNY